MSKVALEGMQFYAFHGYYEEERLMGTYFIVDVYVDTNFMMAASTDDLGGTVNYETIYFICRVEMKRTAKLIETVAQRIHNKLSALFTSASGITVRISKMNPPLGGPVARSFVEVGGGAVGGGGGLGGGFDSFGEEDDDDGFGGMMGRFGDLGF